MHVVIPEYPGSPPSSFSLLSPPPSYPSSRGRVAQASPAGYGTAPGRPNEISVYNNVKAAYDMIVHGQGFSPKRVIMFGRSIGTGPAIKLASEVLPGHSAPCSLFMDDTLCLVTWRSLVILDQPIINRRSINQPVTLGSLRDSVSAPAFPSCVTLARVQHRSTVFC